VTSVGLSLFNYQEDARSNKRKYLQYLFLIWSSLSSRSPHNSYQRITVIFEDCFLRMVREWQLLRHCVHNDVSSLLIWIANMLWCSFILNKHSVGFRNWNTELFQVNSKIRSAPADIPRKGLHHYVRRNLDLLHVGWNTGVRFPTVTGILFLPLSAQTPSRVRQAPKEYLGHFLGAIIG